MTPRRLTRWHWAIAAIYALALAGGIHKIMEMVK